MVVMMIPGAAETTLKSPEQRLLATYRAKYIAFLIYLAAKNGATEAAKKGLFDRIERAIGFAQKANLSP